MSQKRAVGCVNFGRLQSCEGLQSQFFNLWQKIESFPVVTVLADSAKVDERNHSRSERQSGKLPHPYH